MTEIQKTEGEIKVLEAKLSLLKELSKTKSPVEEAYKRVFGAYPPTDPSVHNFDDNQWFAFQKGYNASKVIETPQEPEELKTLYDALQCPLHINGYHFTEDQKDWICKVVEEWLPDEVICDGEEYDMGWNDAIQKVKDNLFK